MLNKIIQSLEKPLLYQKTAGAFWNDEHISKQMLKAHLDPEFEGASRKLSFIDKSAAWIKDPQHDRAVLSLHRTVRQ